MLSSNKKDTLSVPICSQNNMGTCHSEPCIVTLVMTEPEPVNLTKEFTSVQHANQFLENFLEKLGSEPKGRYTFTIEMHSGEKTMKPSIYIAHVFGNYYMYSTQPIKIMPEQVMQKFVDWH